MTVSMIQMILELPDITSIKEKRRIITSVKEKIIRRYKVSMAEIDLHDSLSYSHVGAAVVSNSKVHGERVMQKILHFVEEDVAGRIEDVKIHSETF